MTRSLFKYPRENIQFGPSCSIWFICTFLTLIEYNCDFSQFESKKFLIKIINKMENLIGINDNEKNLSFEPIKNRENENVCSHYFISYNIVFNPFVGIKGLMSEFYEIASTDLYDKLEYYQLKFSELHSKIANLKLNQIYYKMFSENIRIDEDEIEGLISNYEEAKNRFNQLIEIEIEINKRIKGKDKEDPQEFFNIRNQSEKLNNKLNFLHRSEKLHRRLDVKL